MRLDRLPVRGDRGTGGGDGDGADDIGAAALVAGRTRGPRDAVGRYARRRAAAAQVGRSGVEPVAAPGQHPGAVRRIQLVAGEDDVVDAARGDVDDPVRRELRSVDQNPGLVALSDGHDVGQRPELAGDVRGAGDDDQAVLGARRDQRGVQVLERVLDARGHRERSDLDPARLLPGQERRVVLGLEHEHLGPARQGAGEQVRRVGGVAGEDDEVVLAGPDELRHLDPGLLVPRGGDPARIPVAAVDRRVRLQCGVDGGLDADQRRGGRGVVEVGVLHLAGQGRDAQPGSDDGGQLTRCRPAHGVALADDRAAWWGWWARSTCTRCERWTCEAP